MEDTLRVETWVKKEDTATVLILVLMEDTLREKFGSKIQKTSLNPCFNGRYSQSKKKFGSKIQKSLNPCFNGRYSQRLILLSIIDRSNVLILVLMEDTLRERATPRTARTLQS